MDDKLSLLGLILNASVVVQLVMAALLLASLLSWMFILQRAAVIGHARKMLESFEERFWSGMDLSQLYREISSEGSGVGAENIFRAGFKEFSRLRQKGSPDSEAVMDGVQRAMRVALAREEEHLADHLPFLATVGSTSPYIGLFGTVWGIMNSFRDLAHVQQATLAVVAPSISEALIATAMGLFAAIPAVIAYNRYSAKTELLMVRYETFADEFSSILHRNVHSQNIG
ncbi:Cell division and transport-associated protein TolQ [Oceanospirillum multiglobuliferum]|uniref:protein TolQ n=1 Tax=Oceanospirillum multiglobuliferum TaxID=64969 RepID=UPI000999360E|nr:protein TolQ [Oceanospirillum multiglobuliferum]SKA18077.1 Cell division and transport-associated protein TolQ [Oceanospirillum multiglobuliferum]